MRHQLGTCGLLCSVFYFVLVLMSPVCTIIWNKTVVHGTISIVQKTFLPTGVG